MFSCFRLKTSPTSSKWVVSCSTTWQPLGPRTPLRQSTPTSPSTWARCGTYCGIPLLRPGDTRGSVTGFRNRGPPCGFHLNQRIFLYFWHPKCHSGGSKFRKKYAPFGPNYKLKMPRFGQMLWSKTWLISPGSRQSPPMVVSDWFFFPEWPSGHF